MIRKEKGMILFNNNAGKQVGIDLNQHCWIGVKGTPVKTPPSGAAALFRNYYYRNDADTADMFVYTLARVLNEHTLEWIFANKADHFKLIERLTSMGLRMPNYSRINEANVKTLNKHFKELVECIQEGKHWRELIEKYRRLDWFEEHKIPNYQQYDTKLLDFVYNYFADNVEDKYIPQVFWYIEKEHIFDLYELEQKYKEHRYLGYMLSESLVKELQMACKYAALQHLPKLPKNGLRQLYTQLMHTYCINKEKIDSETLTANQLNRNLDFAFGDYVVVIPTTPHQFKDEAYQQSNCVYRMYMSKVMDNRTNVVFIRHKDNLEKSVVTCEVKNGLIEQFLRAYNNGVYESKDPELYAFKKAYQKHLDNNFKK